MINNIEKVNILGVNIAATNMQEILKYIKENIKKISGKYICVSNVHTTIMSYDNPDYMNIQNKSVLAIPDGGPLSSYGRNKGYKNMKRTTGPDLLLEIFKCSKENNYTHYFYGSTEETLMKLKNEILLRFPDIKIVGMYSPPFRELTKEEDKKIIDDINRTKPDFVWVGLGAPKQEIWMYNHKDKVNGLMIGVGAAFDYFAGNIKRAPIWIQNHNLEWLYRLLQDPVRLFPRYLYTNLKFIWLTRILKQ